MNAHVQRPLKIKAWNRQTKLMMRLNNVDCVKGELIKKDHVLLLFTGYCDGEGEELYDGDVFLLEGKRYMIGWIDHGWFYSEMGEVMETMPLSVHVASSFKRLCNYYELGENP